MQLHNFLLNVYKLKLPYTKRTNGVTNRATNIHKCGVGYVTLRRRSLILMFTVAIGNPINSQKRVISLIRGAIPLQSVLTDLN